MNRQKDRWQQCYWKEWAAIKKRWDEIHATWRWMLPGEMQYQTKRGDKRGDASSQRLA